MIVTQYRMGTNTNTLVSVNVGIVAGNDTMFENNIVTNGHVVETDSGVKHLCDGTNDNENPLSSGPYMY